jgi:hypothetical protein
MKTPQAILGVVVAALALAAIVTFYDSSKPDIQTARHANEAAEKTDLLTPASSIAHDFAVLPKSVHSTSATLIAEEWPTCRSLFTQSRYALRRLRPSRRSPSRPRRRCPHLAMPIRSLPQHCPRALNPTSVRAMAAVASTLCAAIMACGVAFTRELGPSDEPIRTQNDARQGEARTMRSVGRLARKLSSPRRRRARCARTR